MAGHMGEFGHTQKRSRKRNNDAEAQRRKVLFLPDQHLIETTEIS